MVMENMSGLQMLLAPGTRIPKWLSISSKFVSVERRIFSGHRVRTLVVRRGLARFVPGGLVALMLPGWGEGWIPFGELKVFQIRNLRGGVLESNFFFCNRCFANTGIQVGERIPPSQAGLPGLLNFSCPCGNTWQCEHCGP
jgi:hypothetical protein